MQILQTYWMKQRAKALQKEKAQKENVINVVIVKSHFVIHPASSYTVLYTVKKDLLNVISVTRASRHLTSSGDIILLFIAIGRLYNVINAVSTLKPEKHLQITKWFTAKNDPLNAVSVRRALRDLQMSRNMKKLTQNVNDLSNASNAKVLS